MNTLPKGTKAPVTNGSSNPYPSPSISQISKPKGSLPWLASQRATGQTRMILARDPYETSKAEVTKVRCPGSTYPGLAIKAVRTAPRRGLPRTASR